MAGNIVQTSTTGPGNGFTQRILTSPDGDIAEDGVVTATGSYTASAPLSDAGGWVTQMVAFRAAGANPTPTPTPTPTPAPTPTLGPVTYHVQGNDAVPQTPQTSVTVPYTAAQAAGDLNVVVVGWNDTAAQVSSVTDSMGNTYQLAAQPLLLSGTASQSIFYAKNIAFAATGANAVTVTFSTAATYPDIRVLEYSGIDLLSPLDVSVGQTGTGTMSSSGTVTTTNSTDLLVGANCVQTSTTGAGSGFTQRLLTQPDGDIAEDSLATAAGSYSATAPLGAPGWWLMQMVAFRAAGSPSPTPTPTPEPSPTPTPAPSPTPTPVPTPTPAPSPTTSPTPTPAPTATPAPSPTATPGPNPSPSPTAVPPQGTAKTYLYDSAGRLIQVNYPNGHLITYTYDAAGNIVNINAQ